MQENWDNLYKNNRHHSIWPWTDLISEVKKLEIINKNCLELGCGMGANIPFFIAEGYEYYGVDGSATAIHFNSTRFPEIKENIKICDFTTEIPFDKEFSLIFDRASITHNRSEDIEKCIELIGEKISSGGYFIGIDWFSKSHDDYINSKKSIDSTIDKIESIQFSGVGKVHFFDQKQIVNLFKKNNFSVIKMEEKSINQTIGNDIKSRASINFVAIKNG